MSTFDDFLADPEVAALFGEASIVGGMLAFEAALAESEAAAGVIPAAAAAVIAEVCRAGAGFDAEPAGALMRDARRAGSLAIPFVKRLTAAVAARDTAAAAWVHWGSTSQDAIDTSMVLATRAALDRIEAELDRLVAALLAHAAAHVETPVLGRTLMQPALVTSLGLKFAQWAAPLQRRRERLRAAAGAALQLQCGGAVGTLAVLGAAGEPVARGVAGRLGLALPAAAWHTQRDDWVALGTELGVLCGSLAKVAKDWSLMAQGEIAELAEPTGAGRGGSSAMPHKRNPVACLHVLAAGARAPQRVAALLAAMPQEHERGLGGWQAELAEWSGLCTSTHAAAAALAEAAEGLTVDTARMARNIESLQGLVHAEAVATALAERLGKAGAHALVERSSRAAVAEGRHLRETLQRALDADAALQAVLPPERLQALFDPREAVRPGAETARRLLASLTAGAAGEDEGGRRP